MREVLDHLNVLVAEFVRDSTRQNSTTVRQA
jgi:hypothetical protein